MNLFQRGTFTLASGASSSFKIECDTLNDDDWAGLAAMAVQLLPSFGDVIGVPRGGIPFADALRPYAIPANGTLLVADDVWTTGGSMQRFRDTHRPLPANGYLGVVAFARGPVADWVMPVWTLESAVRARTLTLLNDLRELVRSSGFNRETILARLDELEEEMACDQTTP